MGQTVWFVGAGFTKALQHRQPIPMMMDFVAVMCHYARRDDVVLMALIGLEAMGVTNITSRSCVLWRANPSRNVIAPNYFGGFRCGRRSLSNVSSQSQSRRSEEWTLSPRRDSPQRSTRRC